MGGEHDLERRPTIGRRAFLAGLGAGALVWRPPGAAAEPPPETTRIRLSHRDVLCEAPQRIAEDLLRAEGFGTIDYVSKPTGNAEDALGAGEIDVAMLFGPPLITRIDAGMPIVFLAGTHVGCVELVAGSRVRTLRDLRGKTVPIMAAGDGVHVFLATILAHVGVDPRKDVTWLEAPVGDWERLLLAGKVDAFKSWVPDAQASRARKVGRVLLNTLTDRPWSQYFCCLVAANRDWVSRHPVATRRALRALLKTADVCAQEPERVARLLLEGGHVSRSAYAAQALREIAFRWRDYVPEDAVRFYALRLREAGLIRSTPQQILARGTDWRYLDQLRKELKG
jgi:NitT/TauT family transport system substrate-binding protein